MSHASALNISRVALRTLILMRWVVVVAQLATVLLVHFVFDFSLPLLAAGAIIASSAILNLLMTFYRRSRRLQANDAALFLGFDIVQLSAMLAITGGLANPFSVLLLGPLTVAAGLLSRPLVVALTALALLCLTILGIEPSSLPWQGPPPAFPPLYNFGVWLALAIACCFIAGYNWSVSRDTRQVTRALSATQTALAKEQKWSALGALAAAVAHELGTPLGTIAVIVKELGREIPTGSPLTEDIALLQSQSDRCREILAELARQPEAVTAPFAALPLPTLLDALATPYHVAGIACVINAASLDSSPIPTAFHSPELSHGLGNLIQNATQFAVSRVELIANWDRDSVHLTIRDDGPGFPPGLLSRIGDPYISTRAGSSENLGLGIFIASTLLERTGATLHFENSRTGGAEITCIWSRSALENFQHA